MGFHPPPPSPGLPNVRLANPVADPVIPGLIAGSPNIKFSALPVELKSLVRIVSRLDARAADVACSAAEVYAALLAASNRGILAKVAKKHHSVTSYSKRRSPKKN